MSDETENATKVDEFPAWQQAQMRAAWDKWNSGAMDGGPAPTPTAALVEETLIKDALELCGTRYELQAGYKHHLLKKLAHALQRTIAERDAQRAEVLRLTGERDAARDALAQKHLSERQSVRYVIACRDGRIAELLKTIEELRAQVWGLICAGSNMAERRRYFQGLWETLLANGLKRDAQLSELTATRDLLTAENARLQKEVATLELLLRGGK